MWKPPVNFLSLHYAWIITLSILSLLIIYPYGNLKAVDAYFFGASASTNSDQLVADNDETLYILPPWKRDKGASFAETKDDIDDKDERNLDRNMRHLQLGRSLNSRTGGYLRVRSWTHFCYENKDHTPTQKYVTPVDLPEISSQITIGR